VDRVAPPTFDEIAKLDPADVIAFDRGAIDNWSLAWQDRSDYLKNAFLGSLALVSISPPIFGHAWSDAVTLGVMSVEVLSLAVGVTDITKALAHRPRPYLYNQSRTVQERYDFAENKESWGYLSFFSGHVASSFAAATFVSTVFGEVYGPSVWSKVVWGVTMSTAALVAYARVEGGVHFPTDVIMGAAVGSALGYLVPTLHRSTTDSALSLSVGPTAVGIRLTLR
jgi:membrane-associated phospholipid phosphatase